jgi:hypothetical protein
MLKNILKNKNKKVGQPGLEPWLPLLNIFGQSHWSR